MFSPLSCTQKHYEITRCIITGEAHLFLLVFFLTMGDNVTEVLIVKITRDIWRESSKHLFNLPSKQEISVTNIGLWDSNMYCFSFPPQFSSLLPWSVNLDGKLLLSFSKIEIGIRTQPANTVLPDSQQVPCQKEHSRNPGKLWPNTVLPTVLAMNQLRSTSSSENEVPLNSSQPAESMFSLTQTTKSVPHCRTHFRFQTK